MESRGTILQNTLCRERDEIRERTSLLPGRSKKVLDSDRIDSIAPAFLFRCPDAGSFMFLCAKGHGECGVRRIIVIKQAFFSRRY